MSNTIAFHSSVKEDIIVLAIPKTDVSKERPVKVSLSEDRRLLQGIYREPNDAEHPYSADIRRLSPSIPNQSNNTIQLTKKLVFRVWIFSFVP